MSNWNPNQPNDPYGQQGQPGQPGQPQYGQQPPQYGQEQNQPGQPQYGQPAQPQYGQQSPAPQYGAPPAQPYGGGGAYPPGPPYGGGAPVLPGEVGPLNMGSRVVAFIIDALIYLVVWIVIFAVAAAANSGAVFALGYLIILALGIYFIYLTGSTGQTPGKKFQGVKVVDALSGQPIGFGRAFGRVIVQGLSNIVCYAGLWSAWLDGSSGQYRGWHDKALNTRVISVAK